MIVCKSHFKIITVQSEKQMFKKCFAKKGGFYAMDNFARMFSIV